MGCSAALLGFLDEISALIVKSRNVLSSFLSLVESRLSRLWDRVMNSQSYAEYPLSLAADKTDSESTSYSLPANKASTWSWIWQATSNARISLRTYKASELRNSLRHNLGATQSRSSSKSRSAAKVSGAGRYKYAMVFVSTAITYGPHP
jgi:hypothetical protein